MRKFFAFLSLLVPLCAVTPVFGVDVKTITIKGKLDTSDSICGYSATNNTRNVKIDGGSCGRKGNMNVKWTVLRANPDFEVQFDCPESAKNLSIVIDGKASSSNQNNLIYDCRPVGKSFDITKNKDHKISEPIKFEAKRKSDTSATTGGGTVKQVTVTGTVMCDSGDGSGVEPCVGVNVQEYEAGRPTTNGVNVDEYGKFTLEVKPGNKIRFGYVGFKEQFFDVSANRTDLGTITMLSDSQMLGEVVAVACASDALKNLNASSGVVVNDKCVPTVCSSGYVLLDETYKPFSQPDTCTGENDAEKDPATCNVNVKCVKECTPDLDRGIAEQSLIDGVCYPSECVEPRWELKGSGKNAKCEEQKCEFKNGTGEWVQDGGAWACKLKECKDGYNEIDGGCVKECLPDLENGILKQEFIDGKCMPVQCVENRWMLSGKVGIGDKCEEQECKFENGTGEWVQDGDAWDCKLKECKNGYQKENSDDGSGEYCREMLKKCTDAQAKEHPNATKTGIKKGTETCVAQECKCGFELKEDNCVAWVENKECTADTKPRLPDDAASAKMVCENDKAVCKIDKCVSDDYELKDNKCESKNKQPCTPGDKNATAGEYKNRDGKLVCVITACKKNYSVDKENNKCVAGMVLSEEDQKARVAELEENAQKMRDKEQSMENKLLGAAGMGMTGMGLMQSMSAGAEQKADEAAELDMAAYLATMHCNYAPGKNVKGGEKEVELPGANSLLPLYTEYVALANDLKVRKEALGMRPGIESEAILDGATSGLYDDVALGKTSGAYTSLARALSDPNGEDAKKWAAQKEETAKDKKTGTTLAAVGAIGSAVANIAINKNAPKEGSEEIESKYDKKRVSADALEKGDKDGVDGDNGNSGGVAPVPKNDKIADKKCDPACDANTHDCVDGVCVKKTKNLNQEQVFVDICDNDSLNGKPGYYCIDGDFEFESKNIDVLTTFAKEYAKQRHGRSINCDKELIDSDYDKHFYLRCADGNSAFYNFDFRISDFADEEDMSDNICYIYFGDDCPIDLYSIGMFDVMRPFVESVGYNFVLDSYYDEYELKKCSGGCSGKTLIPNENQSVIFDKTRAVEECSVYGESMQDSDNCINADEEFEFDYNDINLFTKYAKEYAKQKYGRIIDCDDVLVEDTKYTDIGKHDLICADENGLFYDFEFYISDSVTDENKMDNICGVYSSMAYESEKQSDKYFCDYVKSKDLCNVILPFAESVGYRVSFEDEECIIYKK